MKILIGKEPSEGRLEIAVQQRAGKFVRGFLGTPGSVPNTVSRCKAEEGIAHASISIDGSGKMTITNMKPQNITWVNGNEVESKIINNNASIALGRDKFAIDLAKVLELATKLSTAPVACGQQKSGCSVGGVTPPAPPRQFNIKHLERIRKDYDNGLKQLGEKQRKINLVRAGCGMFTVLTVPLSSVMGPIAYVFTAIGVLGNVYSFWGLKNDNTAEERERLTEEFQDNYCCPNPQCNKFLGNYSYRLLKRQFSMKCPHCKAEFVEK